MNDLFIVDFLSMYGFYDVFGLRIIVLDFCLNVCIGYGEKFDLWDYGGVFLV